MDAVIRVLADLSTYPSWNDLVGSVETTEAASDDPGPAWRTTLTAKVGPFARSKQLRFVRDTLDTDGDLTTINFVRREGVLCTQYVCPSVDIACTSHTQDPQGVRRTLR